MGLDSTTVYHYVRGLLYAKELLEKAGGSKAVIKKLDKEIEYYKSLL
jgi:hypothetical protein